MSIRLMAEVWRYEFKHDEQAVLLAMADHADDEGRNCYPSMPYLAWKTGYSERQVRRAVRGLEQAGVLEVLRPGSGRQSTSYWIRLDKAAAKAAYVSTREDKVSAQRGQNVRPERTQCPPREDILSRREDTVSAKPLEASQEPSREPSQETRGAGRSAVAVYEEVARRRPNAAQADAMEHFVSDVGKWEEVVRAWLVKGFKNTNVEGMLQVYREGWATGKGGRAAPVPAAVPAMSGTEWMIANGYKSAISLAPAVLSADEITF